MQVKKAKRKLIKPLKVTGLPFVARAKLAKALVRGGLYGDDLVRLLHATEAQFVDVESFAAGCTCCTITKVSYYVKDKYFEFSSRYGSFDRTAFGL